jgi:hypothetical protein
VATTSNTRSRTGLERFAGDLDNKSEKSVSKSSNLLKKSAPRAEVEEVTSAEAHGTAEKASVPVHHPLTENGISKVNLKPVGKEIEIGEDRDQELFAEDKINHVNVTDSEDAKKEDAVDALLEVPRSWTP